ncbi:type II toxin-antitoxin system RelE/ParE family toxin [Aquirufa sp. ROCK-SH2]
MKNQNGLYEVRIEFQSNIFWIFCCFDELSLVILFNGFHKKSKKTPQKEIQIAEKLKKKNILKTNEKYNNICGTS